MSPLRLALLIVLITGGAVGTGLCLLLAVTLIITHTGGMVWTAIAAGFMAGWPVGAFAYMLAVEPHTPHTGGKAP